MRLPVRWLVFSVTIIGLLIFILQVYSQRALHYKDNGFAPPNSNQKTASKPEGVGSAPIDGALSAFWTKWSSAMYAARPEAPDIVLNGHASTRKPVGAAKHRSQPLDFIRNPEEDLVELGNAHAQFVRSLQANITEADISSFSGTGVVMVGGGEYFGPAIISLYMLRRTGSNIPAEVFVPDDSEYEPTVCEEYLPRLNAKCRVLSHILGHDGSPLGPITHYQLKAVALLLSSFSEALLLDSDSIPLVDPMTQIFRTEPYQSDGLLIWPDFWAATESPRLWTVAGLSSYPANLPAFSSEAGQLAVNKNTHLAPLLLATYYNIFGTRYYYHLLSQGALGEGDKETFLAAAAALNATYYFASTSVISLGRHDGNAFRGTAMVQHLPVDEISGRDVVRPAFLHCNTPKMNAGHLIDEGDLVAKDDGKIRLRLLGSREDQVSRFGFDIESSLWDLLVQTGCELADVIREWRPRERMCQRLTEARGFIIGRPSD